MRQYFEISGYWKDDNTEFEGYIVTNYDDFNVDNKYGFTEEDIFEFGWNEGDLKEAIRLGEKNCQDFVITEYIGIK